MRAIKNDIEKRVLKLSKYYAYPERLATINLLEEIALAIDLYQRRSVSSLKSATAFLFSHMCISVGVTIHGFIIQGKGEMSIGGKGGIRNHEERTPSGFTVRAL